MIRWSQACARRGYRALSNADLRAAATSAPPPPTVDAAVARALNQVATGSLPLPLRLRTAAWTQASGGRETGHVWIVGELDTGTRREPGWLLGARGELTVVADDGSPVASRTLQLSKGQATFVVGSADIGPLPPGDYQIRVRLRAEGSTESPITSSVQVSVPPGASPLGEPVLRRRGPQTGVAYVETADGRFRRTERLRLELPTSSAAAATARLLDRLGNPMQVPATVSMRDDAGAAFRWIVVDAQLAPFATGDYVIEVTQDGASELVAFRIVQ
jgi:hypothetical protein